MARYAPAVMYRAAQLAIATPLVAVLAAGGCAGGQSNSDSSTTFKGAQRDVAKVVEDFQKAAEKQDGTKVCRDLITVELQARIIKANTSKTNGCAQAVKDGFKDTDQSDLTVTAVRLSGTTGASAVVKQKLASKKNRITTLTLEKVGGRWRISRLTA